MPLARILQGSKRLLIVPPVLVGLVIVVVLVQSREGPQEAAATERSTSVRVLRATETSVVPRAIGYGVVKPSRVWQAVAQVAGRVIEKNARVQDGASASAGTMLLRIDPQPYELAIRETEAQIATLQAELTQIDTREENTQRTLELERRSLEAHERELERKKQLREEKVVAQSDVDQEENRYLAQLVRAQDLENSLALIPAERQSLEANMRSNEVKLELARLDLSYTTIIAPFDCRLVSVDFEETQYVGVGEVLAEAHDVAVAEITAQMPMSRMRPLVPELPRGAQFVAEFLTGEIVASLGWEAEVRMTLGQPTASWEARVERVRATIDPETRTLGVVVVVDSPYEQAIPGIRPPLVKDMFCEVELRGRPKEARILVPRSAVHDSEVYVVSGGRLQHRPVEVLFNLHDYVCLASGLQDGEVVVVSDPVPAIEGMLLNVTVDEAMEGRVAAVARGEAPIR